MFYSLVFSKVRSAEQLINGEVHVYGSNCFILIFAIKNFIYRNVTTYMYHVLYVWFQRVTLMFKSCLQMCWKNLISDAAVWMQLGCFSWRWTHTRMTKFYPLHSPSYTQLIVTVMFKYHLLVSGWFDTRWSVAISNAVPLHCFVTLQFIDRTIWWFLCEWIQEGL